MNKNLGGSQTNYKWYPDGSSGDLPNIAPEPYNTRQMIPQYNDGGDIIKDDMGQWAHPGEITEINSPYITMRNVNYPVLGISKQTGEKKLMLPEKNYKFANTKQVVEYPIMGWMDKYK